MQHATVQKCVHDSVMSSQNSEQAAPETTPNTSRVNCRLRRGKMIKMPAEPRCNQQCQSTEGR